MAVISILRKNGNSVTKAKNGVLSNININGVDYHFAKPNEVDRVCENAVEEPIIDLKINGNSVQGKLPSEYQQVEYIESTGTQYIDTDYIAKKNTKAELTLSFNGTFKNATPNFFGALEGDYTFAVNFGQTQSTTVYPWVGKSYAAGGKTYFVSINDSTRENENVLSIQSGAFKYGDFEKVISEMTEDLKTVPLALFGRNVNGVTNPFDASNMRLYGCKIYENEQIVRDFIPCNRKSDNVAGLYDLVEDKFYTNAGTGTFLVGNNTPTPETPIEIESVGEYDETIGKYKVPVKVNDTTTNIYINEPLRKIGDYADYIDYKNKKVVRNIKSRKMLSDYSWQAYTSNTNGNPCYWTLLEEDSLRSYGHTICSHFKHRGTAWSVGVYGEYSDHPSNNRYYFVTDKATLDEWKEWLNNNDVRIDFILLTPTEETIEVPEISTNKGTNIFDTDTSISPSEIKINYWKQI